MQIYKFVSDRAIGELTGSCGPHAQERLPWVRVTTQERFPQRSPSREICVLLYTRFFALMRRRDFPQSHLSHADAFLAHQLSTRLPSI